MDSDHVEEMRAQVEAWFNESLPTQDEFGRLAKVMQAKNLTLQRISETYGVPAAWVRMYCRWNEDRTRILVDEVCLEMDNATWADLDFLT